MIRLHRLAATIVCVVLLSASPAAAQFTWNGGGSNDNWSSAANWGGTGPSAGGGTAVTLTFGGTTRTNTVMDLGSTGSPFVLNGLTVNNDASNGFTISGGPLQFAGTNPTLTFNGGAGVFLRVNSAINFAANTTIDNTSNSTPLLYEINLTGALTGGGNVTLAGPGIGRDLAISSRNNTLTGTVTQSTVGGLYLGAANALGRSATLNVTAGVMQNGIDDADTASGVLAGGFNQQFASITVSNGAFLQIGATANAATTVFGFNNTNNAIAGAIIGPNAASHLGKVGTGTVTYTGVGPYVGSLSVRDGTFDVRGTAGVASGGFSNAASTGTYSVYAGATLSETITSGTGSFGRIGNATIIGLNGGTLTLDVVAIGVNASGFSEVVGSLGVNSGQSTLRINTSGTTGTNIAFGSMTLSGGTTLTGTSTLFIQSGSLGTTNFDTAGAGNVAIDAATGPAASLFVGTTSVYAPAATNMRILPFAFAATSSTGAPATFVTYDSANQSLRGLENTNYASNFGTAADNVSLNAAVVLAGPATANAVRLTSGGSIDLANNSLTVTSGALLNDGGGNIIGTGTVNFGAGGAATAYITTNGAMSISAPLAATNLSKNGAGNLTLGGAVTLAAGAGNGTVAVNAGTLTVGAGAAFTNATTFQVSRSATLDVTANGLVLGTGQTVTGAGAVTGSMTVNSGGRITPSALGGPNASRASPGTLTVNGNVTLNGGANYTWFVNSSLTNGNNSVTATAGTLADFKSPYTASLLSTSGNIDLTGASSGNRINIEIVSLALSNSSGSLYDLNGSADSRSWVIAEATGGGVIVGFSTDKFDFNTTGFSANSGAGTFQINQVGQSLVLTFTPVPEPGTVLALSVAALAFGALTRRIRTGRSDCCRAEPIL